MLIPDGSTMVAAGFARARAGLPMRGVIEVTTDEPIGRAIAEIHLIAVALARGAGWTGSVLAVLNDVICSRRQGGG